MEEWNLRHLYEEKWDQLSEITLCLPSYTLAFHTANEDIGDFSFLSNHEENSEIISMVLCYLQS